MSEKRICPHMHKQPGFLWASFECAFWNLRLLRKNIRFYLCLFAGLLICFFLTEKIISLAAVFGTKIQVFEPFIFSFADGDSVLFASLALMLPLSLIPQLTAPASYLIFRSGKKSWIMGQMITAVLISVFYSLVSLPWEMLPLRINGAIQPLF